MLVQNFVHILVHSERSLGKLGSKLGSKLGPPGLNPARQKLGWFEWEWSKKFILEVKTVKTRKNTEWCENLSKSTMIWDHGTLCKLMDLHASLFNNSMQAYETACKLM